MQTTNFTTRPIQFDRATFYEGIQDAVSALDAQKPSSKASIQELLFRVDTLGTLLFSALPEPKFNGEYYQIQLQINQLGGRLHQLRDRLRALLPFEQPRIIDTLPPQFAAYVHPGVCIADPQLWLEEEQRVAEQVSNQAAQKGWTKEECYQRYCEELRPTTAKYLVYTDSKAIGYALKDRIPFEKNLLTFRFMGWFENLERVSNKRWKDRLCLIQSGLEDVMVPTTTNDYRTKPMQVMRILQNVDLKKISMVTWLDKNDPDCVPIFQSLIAQLPKMNDTSVSWTFAKFAELKNLTPEQKSFITKYAYVAPRPEEVPTKMNALFDEVRKLLTERADPIRIAAIFHCGILDIHPFADRNGRLARLVMFMILMAHGIEPKPIEEDVPYTRAIELNRLFPGAFELYLRRLLSNR